ncbi:MAG: hypothetical protein ACRDHU_07405 [Actinomycetota bacterium]
MRRLIGTTVAAVFAFAIPTLPASSIPGPDPNDSHNFFEIFLREITDDRETYEVLRFQEGPGWDFGDRYGYACAWAEFIRGGAVQFRIDFEIVVGPHYEPGSLQINDRYGREGREGQARCGDGQSGANLRHDGSSFVPGGATFIVRKGNDQLARYRFPKIAEVNDESFWSIGDQKREAYLWYGEEGEDPVPVLRALVKPVAANVSVEQVG